MKEDESLRVERETVTAYRSTRKRQADAKRHVERDEPSRSEGLNCNERLGSRTERGRNAGTRLKSTKRRRDPAAARATRRRTGHGTPRPAPTGLPCRSLRTPDGSTRDAATVPPTAVRPPRPGERSGLRSFPPSPELTTCDDSILHTITT